MEDLMSQKKGVAEYWNKVAPKYDRIVRQDLPVYDAMYDVLLPYLNSQSRVLDVASGTGILAIRIAEHVKEVRGADISSGMVDLAKRKAREQNAENCSFNVQDIYMLSYERKSFDVIIAANVLHLLDDPAKALSRLSGFLKPGGVMLLPTYCHGETLLSMFVSRIAALAGFQVRSRWSVKSYIKFIDSSGFTVGESRCLKGLFPIALVIAVPEAQE
jgi:phosphatidylethanolamine/phosphatidyl-N-methylethanolamine N-methyltransferase